jgi:hydrogenase maturation protease
MTAPWRPILVLVCGSPDRGDDAAGLRATELLGDDVRSVAEIRVVGQLGIEHLIDRAPGAAVLVVDAAVGLAPGLVRRISFAELASGARSPVPRSSHELPIPEVVGIAELIAGPLTGGLVVIGGLDFSLGETPSPAVRDGLGRFAREIEAAIEDAEAATRDTDAGAAKVA